MTVTHVYGTEMRYQMYLNAYYEVDDAVHRLVTTQVSNGVEAEVVVTGTVGYWDLMSAITDYQEEVR